MSSSRALFEEQFNRLLGANRPALSRLAASYTRSPTDRDDLLQEIAMALWQALPRFRHECSDRTFLFRIAHNRGIAHATRRRPAASLTDDMPEPADPAPGPEASISRDQEGARLVRAVHRLPVLYRQVIILALEDLSYREIGDVLGIGESKVGVRLTCARTLLAALMREHP